MWINSLYLHAISNNLIVNMYYCCLRDQILFRAKHILERTIYYVIKFCGCYSKIYSQDGVVVKYNHWEVNELNLQAHVKRLANGFCRNHHLFLPLSHYRAEIQFHYNGKFIIYEESMTSLGN